MMDEAMSLSLFSLSNKQTKNEVVQKQDTSQDISTASFFFLSLSLLASVCDGKPIVCVFVESNTEELIPIPGWMLCPSIQSSSYYDRRSFVLMNIFHS
jgi:hypothetical protein